MQGAYVLCTSWNFNMTDTKRPPKIAKLDGEDEEDSNHKEPDEKAQAALEKIVGIQNEIDHLNEQASEEILRVEQKYNQLRKPHYKNRAKLCNEIPEFWYTTFINHPAISELLNDEDEQVLQYLEGLSVDEFEDVKSGFKISMLFKSNPFFENDTLSKEYVLDSSGESTITGTNIIWREGKDLTARVPSEDDRGRKRPLEEPSSIFCWFSDCNETDDIAEIIKDEIWPNPLQYFLQGEVSIEEEEEVEDEEDEEEDEDDELVDLDEDEDGEDD